ncbi:hypothetical protein RJ639_044248 [Escallonia herrerae]|uniref:MATH domain-containing protein n=1 Tax=Escallonia herrerae TaxID=1293975 RepID=A0AA88W946_9ASTE|nr:hypothetical protein RJ639_044248 [Escallonia herrerae]
MAKRPIATESSKLDLSVRLYGEQIILNWEYIWCEQRDTGVVRSLRKAPPTDYRLRVETFSLLSSPIESIESGLFEAGGYKWRLSFYPRGRERKKGENHVSLYVEIKERDKLPRGWKVSANIKMFVFDHNKKKYLTIQDEGGSLWRFSERRKDRGFDLLPEGEFRDASNGYLKDDSCELGVEVFVAKHTGKGESVSIVKSPKGNTYTWEISKFSTLDDKRHSSEEFTVGGRKWMLRLQPKGYKWGRGISISLHLFLADWRTLPPEGKIFVNYKLLILNKFGKDDYEHNASEWFSSSHPSFGQSNFFKLEDLKNLPKGFLVNDAVTVQAQILRISQVKDISP